MINQTKKTNKNKIKIEIKYIGTKKNILIKNAKKTETKIINT